MKLTLPWLSDKSMRCLFSNVTTKENNCFILLMVFHNSCKGGFDREISIEEANKILRKENPLYYLEQGEE